MLARSAPEPKSSNGRSRKERIILIVRRSARTVPTRESPYLLRPCRRGWWRTSSSTIRAPAVAAATVGMKRCRSEYSASRSMSSRRYALSEHPVSRTGTPVIHRRTRFATHDASLRLDAWLSRRLPRDPPQDAIRHPRREPATEPCVLTAPAITRDQIEAFLQLGHEREDVGRVILQVTIHADHDISAGVIEAGLERGRLSIVPGQGNQANPLVGSGQGENRRAGSVAAAVVHEEELPRRPLAQCLPHALYQGSDVRLLIQNGDDRSEE